MQGRLKYAAKRCNFIDKHEVERHFHYGEFQMFPTEANDPKPSFPDVNASGGDVQNAPQISVCFGQYEVDLRKRELRKGGLKLKIPRQSFQILAALLAKPGEVVTRDTLRQLLWPSDVFVDFEGGLNVAVQKLRGVLQDTSREPRYVETVPKVGYRFIADIQPSVFITTRVPDGASALGPADLRSLEREVQVDRFAPELPKALAIPSRRLRYMPAAILSLLMVLIGIFAGYRYGRQGRHVSETPSQASRGPSSPTASPTHTRRSVAILGFANVSGNAHNLWLSTAFSEMLATELAAGDEVRTVAGEHVARAKVDLALPSEDSYTNDTLTRIHKDLGCDYVVAGSYVAIGQMENGRIRLDARLQDALTGETVANIAVTGSRKDLFDLASRAGEQLRTKLGVGALTETEFEEVRVSLPSSPVAAKLYSEGVAHLRVYDNLESSHLFEKVIRLQPTYAPAYSGLASAWSALGYDTKAALPARKAVELSRNQTERTRLEVEARYYKINRDWTREIEVDSRLQRSYPDNLDYGLDLASAQLNVGNTTEAAATIARLRQLPPPQRDDPTIDLMEAAIAGDLADYKRERTLAESAASKAKLAGARLLLARAKLLGGTASFFLGNLGSAVDADTVAQQMFAESGDFDTSAVAAMDIGGVLATQGDIIGARHSIEQALGLFRKQGDQARLATAVANLGEMYEIEGNLPKAENLFREALAVSTNLNRIRDVETYNLADSLQRRGKFREAKGMLQALVEHVRKDGNKSVLGAAMQTLGSIAETQGDLTSALRMYQDAVAQLKETGDRTDYTAAERCLGNALLREGDFVRAQQAFSDALSLDRKTGAKTDTALDEVGLAELSLVQTGSVDTVTLRSVVEEFRRQKITDGEIEAEITLSRGIIQQGNVAEAAALLRQTTILSAKSFDPTVRFEVTLANAHLRTVLRRFKDARRSLVPALQRANAIGCVRCQLDARLELGKIEIQAGNTERGHAQLRDLADEARRRGFRLIAERAKVDAK